MEITERMGPPDQLRLADFRLTSESSERSARIRIERLIDGYWSGAAATSSQLLVHSGSVTEGLRLVDQARRRAEPLNSTIGTLVAGCGALNSTLLGNPREAKEWCKSELAKPRTAHAAQRAGPDAPAQNYALNLRTMLVNACIWAGEFAEARTYLAEGGRIRRSPELLFFEGEWELAGNKLTAWSERSRRSGSRQDEVMAAVQLARLHRLTGERAQAVQALRRALEISVDGGDVLFELTTRSALATMAADTGDPVEAVPHLQRCRQIVAAGENWFGLAGVVERAEAVVAAAQGEYALAEDQFKKAITTFQHYCLAWEEADTLQHWGRALLTAGERARTIERFDAAIEIYRSHGYGTRFIEYVMADKTRARRTRSRRHPAVQAPLTGSDLGGSRRIGEISIAASS